MIIKSEREQFVGCSLCGEKIELSRSEMANPETVLMHLQAMRLEHKGCEQYSLNPDKARIERTFYVRMRVEMAALTHRAI